MRVYLRRPQQSDREEFTAAMAASRGLHHPWTAPPTSAEAFEEYLLRNEEPANEAFLICRRDDRAIAGIAALSQIFHGPFCNAYLGFSAVAAYAGRGHMTEGLALVLRRGFGALRLHRIEANVQPDNLASKGLVARLGFQQEGFSPRYLRIGGRWRDHERWAILAEDFEFPGGG